MDQPAVSADAGDRLTPASLRRVLAEAGLPVVDDDKLLSISPGGVGLLCRIDSRSGDDDSEVGGTRRRDPPGRNDTHGDGDESLFPELVFYLVDPGDGATPDVVASAALPLWHLDLDVQARVRSWLQREEVAHEIVHDADGDPWLCQDAVLPGPGLADLPPWAGELLTSVEDLVDELDTALEGPDPDLLPIQPALNHWNERRLELAIEAAKGALAGMGTNTPPRARGLTEAILGDLLAQVGRTDEAATHMVAGVSLLTAVGDTASAARSDLNLLAIDLERGRHGDALARCERAEAVLADSGNPSDLDLVYCRQGAALGEMERLDEALAVMVPLERRLSQAPEPSPHLAEVRSTLATVLSAVGPSHPDHGRVNDLRRAAESASATGAGGTGAVPGPPGGALPALNPLDQGRNLANEAALLAREAENALARPADDDPDPLLTAAGRAEQALHTVALAREALGPHPPEDIQQQLDMVEVHARWCRGERDEALELARHLASEVATDRSARAATILANTANLAIRNGYHDEALARLQDALARAEALGLGTLQAKLHVNLALTYLQRAADKATSRTDRMSDRDAAHMQRHILAAFRASEDQQIWFSSVTERARWAADQSHSVTTAFAAMHGAGRHSLVADILERARAQGLPDLGDTGDVPEMTAELLPEPEPEPQPGYETPDGDDDPLLRQVRASLQDLATTPATHDDPLAATRATGGPGAWRWLLRHEPGQVLWAVLEPDGRAHSGHIPTRPPWGANPHLEANPMWHPSEGSFVGPALQQLWRAQARHVHEPTRRAAAVSRGLLGEDPEGKEPTWAWEVGRRLVPDVLADELRRRLEPDTDPLPLVIAPSPGLATVPFGLLSLEEPGETSPLGRRLLEAATITLAPPAGGLVQRVAERVATRTPAARPLPVPLAVVNPTGDTGDLEAVNELVTRHPRLGVDGVLLASAEAWARAAGRNPRADNGDGPRGEAHGSGAHGGAMSPVRQSPTKEDVLAVLRQLAPGAQGVMLIAGHAEPAPGDLPLEGGVRFPPRGASPAGVTVAGSPYDKLTVSDLLQPGIHPPSRAVLYGCSTLGAAPELSEWWGLPIALLYAGSTAVAASMWDLRDFPGSVAAASELLELATTSPDLAEALRQVQMHHLREWEKQRSVDRSFRRTEDDHHPYLWAGWAVVGVRGG